MRESSEGRQSSSEQGHQSSSEGHRVGGAARQVRCTSTTDSGGGSMHSVAEYEVVSASAS